MQVKIDAGQKYRSALLETFNMRDITFLKRANWGGIVAETDRLYSTMFHDWDVLQKDCNDIEKAVKSLDWSIAPFVQKGEKVSPEAEKVAQVVEEALWKQDNIAPGEFGHTFAQLLGVLTHAVWRGQNVHQIVWKSTGDLIYPARFEQLLPQYLQWEMQPGKVDRLLLVEDGEAAMPKPFPQYRFIVALNNSGPDHPLYNATYYSLVAWFAAFKKGLGWFMQFCERFGLPKPVIHYDNKEDKEELIAQLNDQRVINAILLEGDRSVEWATVPASGQSLPQRELLSMAEAACHKAILGQTLTSDTSQHGGSLAQAKVHAGVQADTVMRYAEYVADIINRQLIPAIVHFNFGRLDMPMPELRCKLPQAVANTERAQFWTQVLQIPGMRVNKSDIYDSLGIPMPSEGDDVIETPTAEENALQGLMQSFSKSKEKEPETAKGKKDEVALAARSEEPRHESALKSWLAPLRQKLLEAKRAGASFDELKAMMLQAQLDTRALAGAFADNIKSGFLSEPEEDELDAANPYGCNQYGEGWKMPHNGIQSTRDFRRKKGENKRDLPDTKKLDDTVVPDDDDSEEATKKRAERLNLHRDFAEEMRARLEEWKKQHTMHGSDVVKAAAGTEDDKRPFPVLMPDGSRCHTFGCERHQGADALALKKTEQKLAELEAEMKKAYGKSDFEKLESLLNEHRAWLEYGERCKKQLTEPPKKKFIPAKTIKEAEDYARKLGIPNVYYKDLSLEVVNTLNERLEYIITNYPEAKKYLQYVGSMQGRKSMLEPIVRSHFEKKYEFWKPVNENTYKRKVEEEVKRYFRAHAEMFCFNHIDYFGNESMAGLCVNATRYGKSKIEERKKVLARQPVTKHWPVGCGTIKSVVDHELGHILDYAYDLSSDSQFLYNKAHGLPEVGRVTRDNLSGYAMTDNAETIAEGWSEYLNNPEPRAWARFIGGMVEKKKKS